MDINNVFNGGGYQLQADAEKGTVLAVLLDDKLHPRALEGGAELSDLLGIEGAAEPAAGKEGDAGHDGTLLSTEKALFPTDARRAAPQPRAQQRGSRLEAKNRPARLRGFAIPAEPRAKRAVLSPWRGRVRIEHTRTGAPSPSVLKTGGPTSGPSAPISTPIIAGFPPWVKQMWKKSGPLPAGG